MATTQKMATIGRPVYFRANGTHYSPYLYTSEGDLIQQYDEDYNYYPVITPDNPVRVKFTATSSHTQGIVTPDSITYKIGGIVLAFNAQGVCTTTTDNAKDYFKKDGADLLVIGNIAEFLKHTSSNLEAFALKGTESMYASLPVDISLYADGRRKKVSIAPGDDKNFTLTTQTDSVKLKAGVLLKTGWAYNSTKYLYAWEIADPTAATGWRCIKLGSGTNGTLTLRASQVNTYANVRCTVMTHLKGTQETGDHTTFDLSKVLKSTIVGSDAVGVFDSSDPLDIVCQIFINKTGTGVDVVADTEELDDSMPDGAYLKYVPTLVVRGETASAGPTTWLKGRLTDPAGIDIPADLTPDATTGAYKLYVSEMKGYYGQHTLTMSGMLTG